MVYRKVMFIFSDAMSIDDPAPAGRRLCQSNIVPVVIGIGRVNLRTVERIKSFCGVYFGVDTPIEPVISRIKVILRLNSKALASLRYFIFIFCISQFIFV